MYRRITATGLAAMLLCCSCGRQTYDELNIPDQGGSDLAPVSAVTSEYHYDDEAPKETVLSVYSSDDGICTIEAHEHYYDVTLDLEQGDHYAAGAAYAETIKKLELDYESCMEQYVYENITLFFPEVNEDSFRSLTDRINTLEASLPEEYQKEIDGFADTMSGGIEGFGKDGVISREEAVLIQMIPDVLRGTACSAISLDGSRTVTGQRMTARIMEWYTGSADQISSAHAVLHLKNGKKSLTSITCLGLLDMITGCNDDGVAVGILDVGCSDADYEYKGRTCYTFELRKAVEEFSTAREVGEYMVSVAERLTFSHNILISDRKDVFCAEDCAAPGYGRSVLRGTDTPLLDTIEWNADGAFCIVNSFSSEGNTDNMTGENANIVRWKKYEERFGGDEKFTLGSFKERLSDEDCEAAEDYGLVTIDACDLAFHIMIVDYASGDIQASFTLPGAEGGKPLFLTVGKI